MGRTAVVGALLLLALNCVATQRTSDAEVDLTVAPRRHLTQADGDPAKAALRAAVMNYMGAHKDELTKPVESPPPAPTEGTDFAFANALIVNNPPPVLPTVYSNTQGSWVVLPSSGGSSASTADNSVDNKFNAISNEIRSFIKSGGKVTPEGQGGNDTLKSEVHQAIRDYLAMTNVQPDPDKAKANDSWQFWVVTFLVCSIFIAVAGAYYVRVSGYKVDLLVKDVWGDAKARVNSVKEYIQEKMAKGGVSELAKSVVQRLPGIASDCWEKLKGLPACVYHGYEVLVPACTNGFEYVKNLIWKKPIVDHSRRQVYTLEV